MIEDVRAEPEQQIERVAEALYGAAGYSRPWSEVPVASGLHDWFRGMAHKAIAEIALIEAELTTLIDARISSALLAESFEPPEEES